MQEVEYKLVNGAHRLLTTYFFISTVAVISSSIIQFANCITAHGKLHKKDSASVNIRSTSFNDKATYLIIGLSVNKKWFCYFYLVGTLMTIICIYLSYPDYYRLLIFLLHVIRRLYEEVFISHHNTNYSRMSIFVFLFGLSYYVLMPITIMTIQDFNGNFAILQFISFGTFSLIQYKSHVKLSNIRKTNSEEYGIPYGGLLYYTLSVVCM
ncbi:3-oxo-5-alpha-steroid 4-dehydrogenase domain-containing [Cryptosporidium sp. chipmunk genotype I]|uniref:3-oxo-5-alpha-steroid 4-dehydrogenase domain-containing n=1 Tax=Cryptosporidium sp. chipmunk genotype I TaxID=1280935 RepID=UPI003519F3C6|nr:3-oxo-5-alpha-steroid 4-dehydrogenase domain-containing [Cryptosporidium sp. chipmunk genotype I]